MHKAQGQPDGCDAPSDGLTIAPSFDSLLRANGLDSLDALFLAPNAERLDKPELASWRQRLRLSLDHEGNSVTAYLKRYETPPRRVMRSLRKSEPAASSPAALEWIWLNRLVRDGIPCPQPMAFGQQILDNGEQRSAVMIGSVPGISLERHFQNGASSERAALRPLLDATADLIARFHRMGYVHRDLYAAHVFHDPTQASNPRPHLIDVQRVCRPTFCGRRWIIKDLAALNYSTPKDAVSETDRLRWLKRYLNTAKLDATAKCLVYRIIGKTVAIARHDRRRAARIAMKDSPR